MFQGTRPRIIAAPRVMNLKHSYLVNVSQASSIRYLRLMRPDDPTHVTDVNERPIAVRFPQAGPGERKITPPPRSTPLPPTDSRPYPVNRNTLPSVPRRV